MSVNETITMLYHAIKIIATYEYTTQMLLKITLEENFIGLYQTYTSTHHLTTPPHYS